jgi:hypothetical protein
LIVFVFVLFVVIAFVVPSPEVFAFLKAYASSFDERTCMDMLYDISTNEPAAEQYKLKAHISPLGNYFL